MSVEKYRSLTKSTVTTPSKYIRVTGNQIKVTKSSACSKALKSKMYQIPTIAAESSSNFISRRGHTRREPTKKRQSHLKNQKQAAHSLSPRPSTSTHTQSTIPSKSTKHAAQIAKENRKKYQSQGERDPVLTGCFGSIRPPELT